MAEAAATTLRLHALLVADHIYHDQVTGKYVVAGTFQQINAQQFPSTISYPIGVFIRLSGLRGVTGICLEFVDDSSGAVLLQTTAMQVSSAEPEVGLDFAIEVPPLPLPHAGRYQFRLSADGSVLGTTAVAVRGPSTD